jgi:hypothetical protein
MRNASLIGPSGLRCSRSFLDLLQRGQRQRPDGEQRTEQVRSLDHPSLYPMPQAWKSSSRKGIISNQVGRG